MCVFFEMKRWNLSKNILMFYVFYLYWIWNKCFAWNWKKKSFFKVFSIVGYLWLLVWRFGDFFSDFHVALQKCKQKLKIAEIPKFLEFEGPRQEASLVNRAKMTYNAGVLNPHQLVQLLDVLSDDTIDNSPLANLQTKLQNSFIQKDSLKVFFKPIKNR